MPKAKPSPEQLERVRRWLNPPPNEPEPSEGWLRRDDVAWLVAQHAKMASALERAQITFSELHDEIHRLRHPLITLNTDPRRVHIVTLTAGALASNQTTDPVEAVRMARQALNFIEGGGD